MFNKYGTKNVILIGDKPKGQQVSEMVITRCVTDQQLKGSMRVKLADKISIFVDYPFYGYDQSEHHSLLKNISKTLFTLTNQVERQAILIAINFSGLFLKQQKQKQNFKLQIRDAVLQNLNVFEATFKNVFYDRDQTFIKFVQHLISTIKELNKTIKLTLQFGNWVIRQSSLHKVRLLLISISQIETLRQLNLDLSGWASFQVCLEDKSLTEEQEKTLTERQNQLNQQLQSQLVGLFQNLGRKPNFKRLKLDISRWQFESQAKQKQFHRRLKATSFQNLDFDLQIRPNIV